MIAMNLKFKNILMMDLLQTCSFSLHKHDCCLDSFWRHPLTAEDFIGEQVMIR